MNTLLQLIFENSFGDVFIIFGVPLMLITLAVFWIIIYLDKQRERDFALSGIKRIDRMGGVEFEKYLEKLFKGLGFKAKLVGVHGGDYGADLIIETSKRKIAVQAKRYRKSVGNKAVQEVIAAMKMYGAKEGMVVTNSHFTQAAWNQAKANSVVLWDRQRLSKAILVMKKNEDAKKLRESKWLQP